MDKNSKEYAQYLANLPAAPMLDNLKTFFRNSSKVKLIGRQYKSAGYDFSVKYELSVAGSRVIITIMDGETEPEITTFKSVNGKLYNPEPKERPNPKIYEYLLEDAALVRLYLIARGEL